MIEVKGTRSAKVAGDPTDPLGFRKPVIVGSGMLAGFVGGIIGLAVYLRTFLWAEPATAQTAPPDPRPPQPEEEGGAAPQTAVLAAVPSPTSATSSSSPTQEAPDAKTMTLPEVLGPYDFGIFAPTFQPLLTSLPPNEPANAGLPPFQMKQAMVDPAASAGPGRDAPGADVVGEVPLDTPGAEGTAAAQASPASQRNRAPQNSGPVYLGEVGSGAALAIAMSSLMANSSDADGDPLAVTSATVSSGAIEARNNGFRFTADTEELGLVRISFKVSDGEDAVRQTAYVKVVENQFNGTDGADLLNGTEGRDRVSGFAGDDNIATFGGRDVVYGGLGDDNISGGAGRDTLYGEDGNDVIAGGADADWISGGNGDDRLYGEAGDDHVQGDAGNDLLDGGDGKDTLLGGDGDDTIEAGSGDDALSGGLGADVLSGDDGNDVQFGDAGEDILQGDAGNDILYGGLDADDMSGGTGNDILSGDAGDDLVKGDAGEDMILGGEGNDVALGGADNDVLYGEEGDDLLSGGAGDDLAFGEAGNDMLAGDAGADQLFGGTGDDTLSGGEGADQLAGGAGSDLFLAVIDGVIDTFIGDAGTDTLSFADETTSVTFDLASEEVRIEMVVEDTFSGIEAFVGGAGDDTFIADEGSAVFTGNEGSDLYYFLPGDTVERAPSSYRITDFGMDDFVALMDSGSCYGIRRAQSALEDRIDHLFEDFADRLTLDEPKLRYFHEWTEDYRRTVVEVDFDRDDSVDLTLTMDGEFVLDFMRQQV
jgi:Ca2+-binding RTX toxin-like protein